MTRKQRLRRRRFRIALVAAVVTLLVLFVILLILYLGTLFFKSGSGEGESSSSESTGESSSFMLSSSTESSALPSSSTDTSSGGSSEVSRGETASSSSSATESSLPSGAAGYIQPEGFLWNLVLVNDYNKAPDWCYDEEYIEFYGNGIYFDNRAYEALSQMISGGRKAGITDLRAQSTFRGISVQEKNFNKKVDYYKNRGYNQEEAEQLANKVVKRPGYSEHHTGLAVDMGGSGKFDLEQDFEDTAAFDWLIEHCAEYGFILRFPKDKEAITGVIYEPWHYRYVGVEHATYIMEHGLCLEEYLAMNGW